MRKSVAFDTFFLGRDGTNRERERESEYPEKKYIDGYLSLSLDLITDVPGLLRDLSLFNSTLGTCRILTVRAYKKYTSGSKRENLLVIRVSTRSKYH
jgi:hypothetical protein